MHCMLTRDKNLERPYRHKLGQASAPYSRSYRRQWAAYSHTLELVSRLISASESTELWRYINLSVIIDWCINR